MSYNIVIKEYHSNVFLLLKKSFYSTFFFFFSSFLTYEDQFFHSPDACSDNFKINQIKQLLSSAFVQLVKTSTEAEAQIVQEQLYLFI